MSKKEVKEAKLIGLAMAKLKDTCQNAESCSKCPLAIETEEGSHICRCTDTAPQEWDVDETLIVIGYQTGKGEEHE